MSMTKKDIRKLKTKEIFMASAKKLIDEQGLDAVSIRNVADLSGYSSSALYSYFSSIGELLYYCSADFLTNCDRYINEHLDDCIGIDKVKQICFLAVQYFLKYPNRYIAIFFGEVTVEIVGELKGVFEKHAVMTTFMGALHECAELGILEPDEAEITGEILLDILHLSLLLSIRPRPGVWTTKENIFEKLDKKIDLIFSRVKKA